MRLAIAKSIRQARITAVRLRVEQRVAQELQSRFKLEGLKASKFHQQICTIDKFVRVRSVSLSLSLSLCLSFSPY